MSHQGITKSMRGLIMKTVLRKGYLCRHLGFTTVELIVTIGVMVALAAVSLPMFNNLSPSYNAKHAARNIVSQMQLARINAIRNRVTTVVVFYPKSFVPAEQANSFMIYEDNNNDWIQDPGDTIILARTSMPAKVSLVSATFTSNGSGGLTETTSCGFDSHGTAARNGAVYVTGDLVLETENSQTRTITFNASGKTKISLP